MGWEARMVCIENEWKGAVGKSSVSRGARSRGRWGSDSRENMRRDGV